MSDLWTSGIGTPDPRSPDEIKQVADLQRERQVAYLKRLEADAKTYEIGTAEQAHDEWLDAMSRPVEQAITTGWPGVDGQLGRAIGAGEIITIGAASNVGKTWIMQQLVERKLSEDIASACLFLPLEMPRHEMAARTAVRLLDMTPDVLDEQARGGMIEGGAEFIERYASYLTRMAYYDRSVRPDELPKIIEASGGVGVAPTIVVIDYMQLLGGNDRASTYDRTSANVRKLKEVAKEANVTIILGTQLSRQGGSKDADREPSLGALRDSGVIEEVSDRVLLFWRESDTSDAVDDVRIHGRISKNRHGPRGHKFLLRFTRSMRLEEMSEADLYRVSD